MNTLQDLLDKSASMHHHLCPRQVLGVRMGLYAGEILNLELPQSDKRMYVIVETDGCAVDGISTATNCTVGHRTLRIEDYGKVASTFVDVQSGRAIRISPLSTARMAASGYAPEAHNRWEAQLLGYQRMPAEQLLSIQVVELNMAIGSIISRAGVKAICEACGEEIINEREVLLEGKTLCRSCAGSGYYHFIAELALPWLDRVDAQANE